MMINNAEQWKINRAGLMNFWYYDDQEFEFRDGRLLLRGSNGSGKSVTMQSLIPLLLDGNKSPERLDPFGTKARKMDNYIVGEAYDEDERTSYLYLEFIKPNLKKFTTIGMGLRGRKNKPLDSWYFIITDNNRIGQDLFLYKDMGGKIPLSKKELENRLGTSGTVFNGQKEYMKAVNNHLFGYEKIEDYDELIKLLIQLRSPKLSKDFRPTVIYDIMSNALQTLSDDDLRPMSEAIEQMDAVKSNLENLEYTKESINKIKRVYDQYNIFCLTTKANDYIKSEKEYMNLLIKEKNTKKLIKDIENKLVELNQEKQEIERQLKIYEEKQTSLQENDIFKLQKEQTYLNIEIKKLQEDINKKEQRLDKEKTKERELVYEIKKLQENQEVHKDQLDELIEEMNEQALEIQFDEQQFMVEELYKDIDKKYDFNFIKDQLNKYKQLITIGLNAIKEEVTARQEHEKCMADRDKQKLKVEEDNYQLEQAEVQLLEVKEEYIEQIHKWNNNNQLLKITNESLNIIESIIREYESSPSIEDIKSEVTIVNDRQKESFLNEKATLNSGLITLTNRKNELLKEIDEWKNKKDPEPIRKEEVIRSRKILEEKNIPHIPLYKAIDFEQKLDENTKGIIEEALIDMGLLDALIIGKEYESSIEQLGEEFCDKVIYSKPHFLMHELSSMLIVEKETGEVAREQIDDVLKSILIDKGEEIYINEDGFYQLGILGGKTSGNYKSRYIGQLSRKRYREQLINELEIKLKSVDKDIDRINNLINTIQNKINLLEIEYTSFPRIENLVQALEILKEAEDKLNKDKIELGENEKEVEKAFKELSVKKENTRISTEKLLLPKSEKAYSEALIQLDFYNDNLNNLRVSLTNYINNNERITAKQDRKEEIEEVIDNIRYDMNQYENKLLEYKKRIILIEEQLNEKDTEGIKEQLKECILKLKELPAKKDQVIEKYSRNDERLNQLNQEIKNLTKEKEIQKIRYKTYEESYQLEANLNYLPLKKVDSLLEQAIDFYKNNMECLKNNRQLNDYNKILSDRFHENKSSLTEYNVDLYTLFNDYREENSIKLEVFKKRSRLDINVRAEGKEVGFYDFINYIDAKIEENKLVIRDKDRHLFEDILLNNISNKIKAKIQHSEKWVSKMNILMESMNTSSGLSLSLKWKSKKPETEEQLSTKELVDLLRKDAFLLNVTDRERIAKHFRSKIEEAKTMLKSEEYQNTFLVLIKEVLDYRKWFEFQLYSQKTGENKKELTDNAFFTFSGGEKAMSMYVPLFSAVYSRYDGARNDCPRLISLDEAFAGVDENNIRDMFRLLVELDLSFIINSQVLWGTYDTVPSLAMADLQRPENAKYVGVLRYNWNGHKKILLDYQE